MFLSRSFIHQSAVMALSFPYPTHEDLIWVIEMYELGLRSREIVTVSRLCVTVSFAVHIHHILMGTNCGDQERDHLMLPLEESVLGINMRGTLNPFSQMLLLLLVVIQGGNVKVVKGDGTTASDPSDALAITRAYPHTYAQPLVQLVAADAGQVKKHSSLRFFLTGCFLFSFSVSHCDMSSCCAFCMWYFIAVETILESSRTDSIAR